MFQTHPLLRLVLPLLFFIALVYPGHTLAQTAPLRIAFLQVPDVFPAYVAEAEGFFTAEGLDVKLLLVGSAVEREQLMQAGQIDGMINEISSTASLNRDKIRAKIISIARMPLGNSPGFRLLVGKDSPIKSIDDLAGVPIGVARHTIIEYVTSRMLASLPKKSIVYESVPVLPERMQLLMLGKIKAAVLPDQMGFSAMAASAKEIVNDLTIADYSLSTITFAASSLDSKAAEVKAFMRAWDKACAAINDHPEQLRPLFLQKMRVPPNVANTYPIPPMPRHKVPGRKQWDDVMAWMVETKLLDHPPSYQDSVTDAFLP